MARRSDTSADARAFQTELWQSMSPSRKFALVVEMTESANQICRAGIALRHPEYSHDEIEHAFHRLVLGDALYQRVHPGRVLLDP